MPPSSRCSCRRWRRGRRRWGLGPASSRVRANLLAAESPKASGKVYNVAGGRRVTLLEILDVLGGIFETRPAPRFVPSRPGDVKHSQADIRRATEDLGYRPETGIEAGLEKAAAWFREREALGAGRR